MNNPTYLSFFFDLLVYFACLGIGVGGDIARVDEMVLGIDVDALIVESMGVDGDGDDGCSNDPRTRRIPSR